MHPAPNNAFPGQILPPGPPVLISAEDDELDHEAHDEWEVLEVVGCRKTKSYGIQYKATYIGNWDQWYASPLPV